MIVEPRFKVIVNGVPVMGKGPLLLLREIRGCCSLREAAKRLGMAYSKAWNMIKRMESALGFSVLDRKTGGNSGGGSILTAEGNSFLQTYESFLREMQTQTERVFCAHFSPLFKKSAHEAL